MKSKKVILSSVISLILCLLLLVPAFADTNEYDLSFSMSINAENVNDSGCYVIRNSDTFDVAVSVDKNSGFYAATAIIKYDPKVLSVNYKTSTNSVFVKDGGKVDIRDNAQTGTLTINIGSFETVLGSSVNASSLHKYTATGILANIKFDVIAATDTNTQIMFMINKGNTVDLNLDIGKMSVESIGTDGNMIIGAAQAVTLINTAKHTHTVVDDVAVEPSCDKVGYTAGKHCAVCGEAIVAREEIPALSHTIVVDEAVEPTCTADGKTEGKHCSVCEEVIEPQIVINKVGHKTEEIPAVEATCQTPGTTKGEKCTVCEEIVVAPEVVESAPHKLINKVVEKEATCSEKGIVKAECTECKKLITEEIAINPNNHGTEFDIWNKKDATLTEEGYTGDKYCKSCNIKISSGEVIPKLEAEGGCGCSSSVVGASMVVITLTALLGSAVVTRKKH